ncbi:MAG: molybdopterin-dependent oxidoreductase [Chloroflexi bacterium]|nr:molybdopterin-dependent oxidoreductase [Chloroflexota bacterium]
MRRPPGPFRPRFFRSPLRGARLTSVLGLVLLCSVPIVFLTGLASYAAYNPDLAGNDQTPDAGLLAGYLFRWPSGPSWLYRLNQGTHITLGLVLVPVVLAKLWSVLPKLFTWPPATSVSHAVERLSLLGLVGGGLFTFATGIVNIQYWYVVPGGFYAAHLYGAWIFMGSFAAHAVVKFSTMRAGVRCPRPATPLTDPTGLASPRPAPGTLSRRGLFATIAGAAALLGVMGVGQNVRRLRPLALLAPRGQRVRGDGPNDFPVNKTAAHRGITEEQTGDVWRLFLDGATPVQLSRQDLLALPQHDADLPIACVEGWSTGTQRWSGVRLRDLAALAGVPDADLVVVESLQEGGAFRTASFPANAVHDGDAVLALRVSGADLSLDHGFPARIVVPAAPGVRNTKWVSTMRFEVA